MTAANSSGSIEHFDVLIIGAGLSGIGAAYHLQTRCPEKRYAILEARNATGGTWDLFRYPGVRSDSDMYTLGYRFRPWVQGAAIADGGAILDYIRDTAKEFGIDQRIRLGHRMTHANWSTNDARWTVEVNVTGTEPHANQSATFTCNVLYTCTGYYDYAKGYTPALSGLENFSGRVVHPQQWPADLNYDCKRVVIIGSGATAITLVPAMSPHAAHVTMLQRSPSYVVSRPSHDAFANTVNRILPKRSAYAVVRWKNVLLSTFWYGFARKYPSLLKRVIMQRAQKQLGEGFDVATHFNPRYKPWDERMCLAPDSDIFRALQSGAASVVTDELDTFTSTGIRTRSGLQLDADILVLATGLNLRLLSNVGIAVDGRAVNISTTMAYKGMMLSDVPNLVAAFGYTNASWTLKCDLTAEYVCRVLQFMDRNHYRQFTARRNDPDVQQRPVLDFTSGYVKRGLPGLPTQGSKKPWRLHQNYLRDLVMLRFGTVDDGVMEFA